MQDDIFYRAQTDLCSNYPYPKTDDFGKFCLRGRLILGGEPRTVTFCFPEPNSDLAEKYKDLKDWNKIWRFFFFMWLFGKPLPAEGKSRIKLRGRFYDYFKEVIVRIVDENEAVISEEKVLMPTEKTFKRIIEEGEPTIFNLPVLEQIYKHMKDLKVSVEKRRGKTEKAPYFEAVLMRKPLIVIEADSDLIEKGLAVPAGLLFVPADLIEKALKPCGEVEKILSGVSMKVKPRAEKDRLLPLVVYELEEVIEELKKEKEEKKA